MKKALTGFRERYRENPALCWLYFTLFVFFLLPEYISPFIMVAAFVIFKRQWKKEGRLAKVGNVGKAEMIFMAYAAISFIWSPTKLDTLGTAGMWWLVFIMQIMIFNLARTKEKINGVIRAIVASGAVNGFVGMLQMISYIMFINKKTSKALFVTPAYRYLDAKVYGALPFKISTNMWAQRASAFFSNPNLLATFMIIAFALGVHCMLSAKSKKKKVFYFIELTCISAGIASTMTRAGCYILLAEWAILFVFFIKKHAGAMLALFIPSAGMTVPSILIRYGKLRITNQPYIYTGEEALQSSASHFQIWKSVLNYIFKHAGVLLFGTGFGCEDTGDILMTYGLNKPHSHNFIIEIWVELGIVGLIILLAIILRAFGKLLEIKLKDQEMITLVICILTAFGAYLIFGLSDFIFNSPKQIIIFMILIGLIQALSYISDKKEIQSVSDIGKSLSRDVKDLIHQ